MKKYTKALFVQLTCLFLFLTACMIGLYNYGDMSLAWLPITIFIVISLMFFINFMLMLQKDKGIIVNRFLIKKGRHYSNKWWLPMGSPFKEGKQLFFITIDGADYRLSVGDQHDINKIFGVSFGHDHHFNSVRLGWFYDVLLNQVVLCTYEYKEGKRIIHEICAKNHYYGDSLHFYLYVFKTKRSIYFEIRDTEDEETVHNHTVYPEDMQAKQWGLKPYFGGNQKAPNDIEIKIFRL